MDVIKAETNSDGDEDSVSHEKETLLLALPVSEVKIDENELGEGMQSTDLKEEAEFKLSEKCQKSDAAAEMKAEVDFEFADVSEVKHEPDDKEAQEDGCAQNEENKGQEENMPEMGPYFKPVLRNGPYSRSSDGLYICKVCNKSFGDNFNLTIHYRIHTGERPHVCNECGKCFTQFSNLKIHSLVHTGERPHLCKECGRSFRRAAHLQKHVLLHTGQRPHACIVCSRTFVCLTDLKNHAFIHTMDRPHKCELCTKAFATPARLRRHQFTHKNSA
ncbi:hypothetical protein B7P43_G05471 [Cryptotermes secundus]|uniref:C2H2-type domain-containing protein n=1 Tax=Cryptotermes secundus TaxID=105785 RepID=A0A2J7R1F3_9NEOP|nr:gastrula zinc finger protein XlCGF42.1 [Cryptotermes secundus]XP_023706588.1 gastrula zinc finger protein XlCGF42.1 [Cryptotermes secundus]XP_023706590.1 gastrula zinc finger protein XlCGF42.1 [Cryptotermes secundus]XP_023706591.1 gastrula zinc finger protein XlCGF42.1 [Cryptotermes secundus]PNF34665.1 hypothetical protein B7P43_G05471 [Cryptotermes secundus]